MIYTPLTKKALRICFDAHRDQVDKTGLPYVFHPFHLAEQMTDEITCCAALLHDVVEDTDATLDDLQAQGIPPEALEALALLTHEPDVDYLDYVRALSANPVARAVKRADLAHNSDLSRLDRVTEADLARVEKYERAMAILDEAQGRG